MDCIHELVIMDAICYEFEIPKLADHDWGLWKVSTAKDVNMH